MWSPKFIHLFLFSNPIQNPSFFYIWIEGDCDPPYITSVTPQIYLSKSTSSNNKKPTSWDTLHKKQPLITRLLVVSATRFIRYNIQIWEGLMHQHWHQKFLYIQDKGTTIGDSKTNIPRLNHCRRRRLHANFALECFRIEASPLPS